MLTSTPHRVAANRRAQTRIISTAWFPLLNAQLQPQPLTLADADDVCDLCSDWQVARWLSHLSWAFTSGSATQLILEACQDHDHGVGCMLAIRKQDTAAFVGTVRLVFRRSSTDWAIRDR